jgi:hypothetical protein
MKKLIAFLFLCAALSAQTVNVCVSSGTGPQTCQTFASGSVTMITLDMRNISAPVPVLVTQPLPNYLVSAMQSFVTNSSYTQQGPMLSTTVAANIGDTILNLASTIGLPTSGNLTISGQSLSYTGTTSTSITGIPASGTGSITTSIPISTQGYALITSYRYSSIQDLLMQYIVRSIGVPTLQTYCQTNSCTALPSAWNSASNGSNVIATQVFSDLSTSGAAMTGGGIVPIMPSSSLSVAQIAKIKKTFSVRSTPLPKR